MPIPNFKVDHKISTTPYVQKTLFVSSLRFSPVFDSQRNRVLMSDLIVMNTEAVPVSRHMCHGLPLTVQSTADSAS
jgi:hypothetical protein